MIEVPYYLRVPGEQCITKTRRNEPYIIEIVYYPRKFVLWKGLNLNRLRVPSTQQRGKPVRKLSRGPIQITQTL